MISIGNKNKIKKTIIGSNNKIDKSEDKFILKNIVIPILVGLIVAGIVFILKWN